MDIAGTGGGILSDLGDSYEIFEWFYGAFAFSDYSDRLHRQCTLSVHGLKAAAAGNRLCHVDRLWHRGNQHPGYFPFPGKTVTAPGDLHHHDRGRHRRTEAAGKRVREKLFILSSAKKVGQLL